MLLALYFAVPLIQIQQDDWIFYCLEKGDPFRTDNDVLHKKINGYL